jgi:hypothetical protein
MMSAADLAGIAAPRPERLKSPQRKRKASQTARGFTNRKSQESARRRGTVP